MLGCGKPQPNMGRCGGGQLVERAANRAAAVVGQLLIVRELSSLHASPTDIYARSHSCYPSPTALSVGSGGSMSRWQPSSFHPFIRLSAPRD